MNLSEQQKDLNTLITRHDLMTANLQHKLDRLKPEQDALKAAQQALKDEFDKKYGSDLELIAELTTFIDQTRTEIAERAKSILKADSEQVSGKVNDRVTVRMTTGFEITDSTAAVKFVSDSPALHHYLTVTKDFNAYLKTLDEKHLPTFVKQISTFSVAISKPKQ